MAKEAKQAASSVGEFAAILKVALDRAKHSMMKVFALLHSANWTEKELLALKGIAQLRSRNWKELGVKFK